MNQDTKYEEKKATDLKKKTGKESHEEKQENWQTNIKSLKQGIRHIYETKELSDVEFHLGNRIFKAHRLVLGARSPEFEKILFKRNAPCKIICKGVSEKGFEILLKFIYTEELGTTNCEDIISAYQAALHFEQHELIKECENLIEKLELTCKNVCTTLNQAADVLFLKEKCLQFIKKNGEDVIISENFLKAATGSVKEMFKYNCFEKVPIMVVLQIVLLWGAKQFQQTDNFTMVREHLMLNSILGRLRIHMLSTKQLIYFNAKYPNFLSPVEFKQFRCYTNNQSDEKCLPEWCII